MTQEYSPYQWYWSVQDSSPSTQVWTTISNSFVALADATYVAWLAAGNTPTIIDTAANLMEVFNEVARPYPRLGKETLSGAGDITLTNPLTAFYEITISNNGHYVIMPIGYTPYGPALGVFTYIYNNGANVFGIKNDIGGDLGGDIGPSETCAVVRFGGGLGTPASWVTVPMRPLPQLAAGETVVGQSPSLGPPLPTTELPGIGKVTGWSGGYQSGRYYNGASCAGITTVALAANIAYFFPLVIAENHTFDRIVIEVTATGAATNVKLGLYNNSNGKPTSLVQDAGSVAVGTIGVKLGTISQSLNPGVYWLCVVADGIVTVSAISNTAPGFFGFSTGTTILSAADSQISGTFTFGALPALAFTGGMGAITYTAANVPYMMVRAV